MVSKFSKTIISCIFFGCMLFIITLIFFLKDYEHIHFTATQNYKAVFIGAIIFTIFTIIISLLLKLEFVKKYNQSIIIIFTLIMFLIQLFLIKTYYFIGGQDITMIVDNSYSLAYNDKIQDEWYFSTYPNNVFIIFLYSRIFKIINFFGMSEYSHFALIIILCLLSALASLLIYKITYRLTKNYFCSILSWIYYNLLIGMSGWLSIIYTDTLALSFPLIIFYSYLKFKDNDKIILYFPLFIITSAVAVNVKPQSFIIFIAIILYEIFIMEENYKIKLKNISLILLSFILSIVLINSLTKSITSNLNKESNIGYFHYIKMGLNEESWGVFDYKDYKESTEITTKKERDNYNKSVIKERIKEYNLNTYSNHLIRKTLLNFNNGTFGWYWMATYPEKNILSKETKLTPLMKDIYYSEGKYYDYFNFLQQANWLIILILSLLSVFLVNKNYKYILFMTIVGIFMFVSIFEASSRYLFTNIPIFIVCAMYGAKSLMEVKNKIFNRRTRNKV